MILNYTNLKHCKENGVFTLQNKLPYKAHFGLKLDLLFKTWDQISVEEKNYNISYLLCY